jgi:competence protein ComEA
MDFWGAMVALFSMLALVVGLLTASPSVLAQEQSLNVSPAVTSVNINTAGVQTLAANLKGVGESRAMEIVRYRESYGPFESVDELADVKGIGKSTLDMNRSVITLE